MVREKRVWKMTLIEIAVLPIVYLVIGIICLFGIFGIVVRLILVEFGKWVLEKLFTFR